jgi:hypothetical protein
MIDAFLNKKWINSAISASRKTQTRETLSHSVKKQFLKPFGMIAATRDCILVIARIPSSRHPSDLFQNNKSTLVLALQCSSYSHRLCDIL